MLWLAQEPVPVQPTTTQNVAPDPGWLTQPVATVLGGTLAIVGALIALGGVLYAQRRTRLNLEHQLAVQRKLHDEALAVENRRQLRASNLNIAVEALSAADELWKSGHRLRSRMMRSEDLEAEEESRQHISLLVAQLEMLDFRLQLLDLEDSGEAIQLFYSAVERVLAEPRDIDTEPLQQVADEALSHVLKTLRRELSIERHQDALDDQSTH